MNRRKLEKAIAMPLAMLTAMFKPGAATHILLWFYRRHGMDIEGTPNYISSKIWFDGTDYSLISLGNGCTISSNIRILTHDWAAHTVLKGMGLEPESPVGRILPVRIGAHAFIGTGSIVMPGADIGHHSIIAAGTVVRGKIEPYSMVLGAPSQRVGDTRDYIAKRFPDEWAQVEESANWPAALQ